MKKNIFLLLLLSGPFLLFAQIQNRGVRIVLEEGLVIRADLDLINEENGVWDNRGVLRISGSLFNDPGGTLQGDGLYEVGLDWWDEGTFLPGASRLRFVGRAPSRLFSATGALYELELAKTGGAAVQLASRLQLQGALLFNSPENYLLLGDYQLRLSDHTSILGYGAQNYLVTDGAGRVALPANPSLILPVGYDEQTYNPLRITGTAAALQVRCLEHALLDGYTGDPMPHAVDAAWEIFSETDDLVDFDLTLYWGPGDESTGFDRTRSGVASYRPDGWHLPASRLGPAQTNGLFSQNWTGLTDWGLFAVADIEWVGLEEIAPAYQVQVYPIPAREGVWIETEPDFSGRLRLIDQWGRILLHEPMTGRQFYLPFPAGISPGVYYLQLLDDLGGWGRKSVVVAR